MASVDLNALTEVQTPASTDNLLLFNETSNVATRIDYDKLAEAILNKTRSEIGGVSPISAIAALNSRTKAYSYDKATGNFLDWVRTTFTSNGEYYVIYATNNSDGWVSSAIGSCLVQRRNNDFFLTAYINDTNVADNQTIYMNRYVANAWLGWSKLPRRAEMDALHSRIGAIAKETTATDGSVTFTFTGNRYAAILMIQSNFFSGSGIYGLIFKKGAGSSIKSLVGNESLPTIDSNGSITFNMVSWSKAILYTTSGDEFS